MTTQSRLSMFVHSPVPVCFSIFLYVSFHIFDALLLFALHINRCPVFVKTFNHSHKFIQLSLVYQNDFYILCQIHINESKYSSFSAAMFNVEIIILFLKRWSKWTSDNCNHSIDPCRRALLQIHAEFCVFNSRQKFVLARGEDWQLLSPGSTHDRCRKILFFGSANQTKIMQPNRR
jgi:hypothetical protein